MCLAVPGRIARIDKDLATVDYGREQRVARILEGDFRPGDYCVVQGGIVALKVRKDEAEESLRLYQQAIGE
ncbi:hypothetical protein AUJ68_03245 [Candidatus Woesearchaeota archaeon CG1_02_57_44]|nr:MAG: hypothetical protein AUJ68_03245 [Candidatus Woesearchaeota archaeon CG1_02_57_44]